jgi:DtxR family Mn-dependent transcriptional regulator
MPNYIEVMSAMSGNGLSASLEDYLEAIFNIMRDSDTARSKDIAEAMGVAKSSVTGALRALKKKGLANYRPYDCVTLTESGRAVAADIARKHNILSSFFIDVLDVDEQVAQQAACSAEHAFGPEIIGKLLCFIEFVTSSGKDGDDVVGRFRAFCDERSQRA